VARKKIVIVRLQGTNAPYSGPVPVTRSLARGGGPAVGRGGGSRGAVEAAGEGALLGGSPPGLDPPPPPPRVSRILHCTAPSSANETDTKHSLTGPKGFSRVREREEG